MAETPLEAPTDDGQQIYREAQALFERVPPGRAIRLTGVSGQDLHVGGGQLSLFGAAPKKSARLNAALDKIAERYGTKAVTTADLVKGEPEDDPDPESRAAGASRLDPSSRKPGR